MVETNIILGLIRHDKDFRKGFMQKARDIYADIISFIANPNCTCRKRVVAYIEENKESVNTFFEEYKARASSSDFNKLLELINNEEQKTNTIEVKKEDLPKNIPESLKKAINEPPIKHNDKSVTRNDVRGEVIEIEPNPFEYKDVIETAKKENWFYTGLSVLETIRVENEVEKPVWLIFFF